MAPSLSSLYPRHGRLETNKLRNVAKFFAHLLYTDALPWTCLESIRLSEDATTSSSRIFIKILVLVGLYFVGRDSVACDLFCFCVVRSFRRDCPSLTSFFTR